MSRHHPQFPPDWQLLETRGRGSFVSRLVHRTPDGDVRVWEARPHRKQPTSIERVRGPRLLPWAPTCIGWWIAMLFVVGSAVFAVGSLAGLDPAELRWLSESETRLNALFFVGSIFFTIASYLQLLEAINADRKLEPDRRYRLFAWLPARIGSLASLVQLVGAVLFNFNTLDAMLPTQDWLGPDLLVWTPDIGGSICFMAACQLAVIESCHGWWCWRPREISWWVVVVNWIGSVAFLGSAIVAFVLPRTASAVDAWSANLFTFIGAVWFFFAAYLLLPEMSREEAAG